MTGSFFKAILRHHWRQILYWGIGLGFYGYYVIVVIPAENMQQYADLLTTLPPTVLQAFGVNDLATLGTPTGFIGLGFATYAILVLAIYAILAGLNITANEEDAGILDVVLSLPAARSQVILERFTAYAVMTVGIASIVALGLLIGSSVNAPDLDQGRLVLTAFNLVPATLMLMAFTVCMGALARRRTLALGLALAYLVGSYFMDFIAAAVTHSVTNTISRLSLFTYYDGAGVLANGLRVTNLIVLFGLMIYLLWGAVWLFDRRDIGV